MALKIIRRSLLTGNLHVKSMPVNYSDLRRWQGGINEDLCFPELTHEEKRFIVTGMIAEEDAEIAQFEKEINESIKLH